MYKNIERKLCEEKGLISEKGPVPLRRKNRGKTVKKEFNNTHKPMQKKKAVCQKDFDGINVTF